MKPVCIVVTNDPPPIPLRQFDWCVWEDGHEEARNYGYGATRAAALDSFFEQYEDEQTEEN
jgi:hypothetical protein